MVIDVKQIKSEKENEFDIFYNQQLKYKAELPFIILNDAFNIERLSKIRVLDLDDNEVYKTSYNYIENQKEELIPVKYILKKPQKFYQINVLNQKNVECFLIYFMMEELFKGTYIIKINNKQYNCFYVEDGYVIHVLIYDEATQIGELLKPQVVINGKDEYRVYLKDEYQFLNDAITMLALYIDRICFNSMYIKNKSQTLRYSKSYSKVNKYYNPYWLKENFDCEEYFKMISLKTLEVKNKIKKQSIRLLKYLGIAGGILIIVTVILLIILIK